MFPRCIGCAVLRLALTGVAVPAIRKRMVLPRRRTRRLLVEVAGGGGGHVVQDAARLVGHPGRRRVVGAAQGHHPVHRPHAALPAGPPAAPLNGHRAGTAPAITCHPLREQPGAITPGDPSPDAPVDCAPPCASL